MYVGAGESAAYASPAGATTRNDTTMAFLVIGNERYALQIGETPLGGQGANGELPLPLRTLHATLSLMPDGAAMLERAGDAPVSVNGVRLNDRPAVLRHGDRIQVGAMLLVFGDIASAGRTSIVPAPSDSALAALAGIAGTTPTSDTGGRLVRLADGGMATIPAEGVVIGRDPACDIVLSDKGASRRHASIRPSLQGYVISDHSVNGVTVNGQRVDGVQVLGMGDVLRIGDEEFRFEADEASFEPDAALLSARASSRTAAAAAAVPSNTPGSEAAAEPVPGVPPTVEKPRGDEARLLATLEVLNQGVHHGARFRIERPVSQIGRGRQSDIRLDDDSVSGSHATLMRRSVGWVVIDLDSTNGTYVDGNRILGEHALPGPCELRFGGIKTTFRPIAGSAPDDSSTRAIIGVPPGPRER